jgi:hypothetical protein
MFLNDYGQTAVCRGEAMRLLPPDEGGFCSVHFRVVHLSLYMRKLEAAGYPDRALVRCPVLQGVIVLGRGSRLAAHNTSLEDNEQVGVVCVVNQKWTWRHACLPPAYDLHMLGAPTRTHVYHCKHWLEETYQWL